MTNHEYGEVITATEHKMAAAHKIPSHDLHSGQVATQCTRMANTEKQLETGHYQLHHHKLKCSNDTFGSSAECTLTKGGGGSNSSGSSYMLGARIGWASKSIDEAFGFASDDQHCVPHM